MEFIEIQRKLVDTLLKIPAMETLSGRTSLLDGLPDAGLIRDQNIARLDLNRIVGGLQKLGRLTAQGGTRPLIVVVDNALAYVPPGSEVAQDLRGQTPPADYGGDVQGPVETAQQDLVRWFASGGRPPVVRLLPVLCARRADAIKRAAIISSSATRRRLWHRLADRAGIATNHHVIENRDLHGGRAGHHELQGASRRWRLVRLLPEIGRPHEVEGAQLLASNRQLVMQSSMAEAGKRDRKQLYHPNRPAGGRV
jgi:hypothetical protein